MWPMQITGRGFHAPTRLYAGERGELGIAPTPTPVLTWWPATDAVELGHFEIEAAVNENAAQVRPVGRTVRAAWPFDPIPSRSLIHWRVRESGGDWSAWATFRTALWHEADWAARWITAPETDEDRAAEDRGANLLRRTFILEEAPSSGLLYATALGMYDVTLNGVRVGDVELAPGFSSYDLTLYAQGYDVTSHLRRGTNVLEFTLSDGWYRGRNGGAQPRNAWGDRLGLLVRLDVETARGAISIVSDHEWTAAVSPVIRADLMRGQTSDFSITSTVAHPVEVDLVSAPVPSWSPSPAVRRIEERPAASMTEIRPGVSIIDVGQNLTGWLRLSDLGPAGTKTILEYAEHLAPDGDITTAHLDMTNRLGERMSGAQIDAVISGNGATEFEPRHTVHGFRYVRITRPHQPIALATITVVVVHSDLLQVGEFRCDDADLNALHSAAVWSFRGNVVDIPTDCPTRERSGWTGDFQVFAPTAVQLYDIDGFATKWLQSVRDDQADDGVPAAFSPDNERSKLNRRTVPASAMGGSSGWGDALIEIPWVLYRAYGNAEILAASWDSMIGFIEYALSCARTGRHRDREARRPVPAAHETYIWDTPFHFGEWLEPKRRRPDGTLIDPMAEDMHAYMSSDRGEVGTAFLYRSLSTLARMAEVLGRQADAQRFGALAETVRDAWRIEFLLEDGRTATDTQAAYVRALAFDLFPNDLRATAAARLVELIEAEDDHLGTGFLSTGMLLPVLADAGYADLAYKVLSQRTSPSWLYMLDHGATTVWEDWDGVTEDGEAHESLNHYSKGAVVRFLHEYTAGVRQAVDSVGWERVDVIPVPSERVSEATFRLLTPRGLLEVAWRRNHDFIVDICVPPGTQATVTMPDTTTHRLFVGQHQLRSGPGNGTAVAN